MKRTYYLLALVIIASSITLSCAKKGQNPRELSEEEARIEAVLQRASFVDMNGEEVFLADYAGKVVMIDFWETWCGPCLMVFPAMDSLKKEYGNEFEVLAVNTLTADERKDVEEFIANNNYDFEYSLDLNDVGGEVISLGIPFKVYIDPNGFLIKAELGSAGTEGDYLKAKTIIEDNKNL
ncbi:MAG: TlpA disulfide reductase family protein [Balneolaceae bacterium]